MSNELNPMEQTPHADVSSSPISSSVTTNSVTNPTSTNPDPPDPQEATDDSTEHSSNTSSPKETNTLIQETVKPKKEKKPLSEKQKIALEEGRRRLAEMRRQAKEAAEQKRLNPIQDEPDFPSWCSIM